jgi:hypothetical protein
MFIGRDRCSDYWLAEASVGAKSRIFWWPLPPKQLA